MDLSSFQKTIDGLVKKYKLKDLNKEFIKLRTQLNQRKDEWGHEAERQLKNLRTSAVAWEKAIQGYGEKAMKQRMEIEKLIRAKLKGTGGKKKASKKTARKATRVRRKKA